MFFPFHDDNPTVRTPLITVALIVVNVGAFLWMLQLSPVDQQVLTYRRGFVPARIAQLETGKPIEVKIRSDMRRLPNGRVLVREQPLALPAKPRQIYLSLLTCMFLHGGWLHLIGNMWFLWIFGNNVEDRLGPILYLGIYLTGGLLASASHWMVAPSSAVPVIGASGAVATVLGAYAVTWPWARVHTLVFLFIFITVIEVPALLVLAVWFLAQLAGGRQALAQDTMAGVAWWAHIGGFVAGMVLMPVFSSLVSPPSERRRSGEDQR